MNAHMRGLENGVQDSEGRYDWGVTREGWRSHLFQGGGENGSLHEWPSPAAKAPSGRVSFRTHLSLRCVFTLDCHLCLPLLCGLRVFKD